MIYHPQFLLLMKRFLLAFLFAMISVTAGYAQAILATAEYNKTMQPAITLDIPYPDKTVQAAIEDRLLKLGYKGKSNKGYTVFKAVRLPELGPDTYDLYFDASRKSRREKDITTVTMLVSSGYEKFIGDTTNLQVVNNAKQWLNAFPEAVVAYDLEVQISDQEATWKKADKKLANLIDDATDLQRKLVKLQKEIEDNTAQQAAQRTEIERQLQVLEQLKSQRKVAAKVEPKAANN